MLIVFPVLLVHRITLRTVAYGQLKCRFRTKLIILRVLVNSSAKLTHEMEPDLGIIVRKKIIIRLFLLRQLIKLNCAYQAFFHIGRLATVNMEKFKFHSFFTET